MDFLRDYAPVGAIVVFTVGMFQYLRSNELSFRRPYWEMQLSFYIEATSSVATLASTRREDEWEKAQEKFWQLYYGPLCLFENLEVETRMCKIRDILKVSTFHERHLLEGASLDLAHACRNSSRGGWRLPFQALSRDQE
jgi:hypothetical protein